MEYLHVKVIGDHQEPDKTLNEKSKSGWELISTNVLMEDNEFSYVKKTIYHLFFGRTRIE